MSAFIPVYIPSAVGTFHMETADEQFNKSKELLKEINDGFLIPQDKLLSVDAIRNFLDGVKADLIVFQNLTFANAAYMSEVLRICPDCPIVLWTLREPKADGGRLKLNSLTGAYSAANALHAFGKSNFCYVFGAPDEDETEKTMKAYVKAAEIKHKMRSLKMAAIGHTPQGFGFGRALDIELMNCFGVELECIEARELIDKAKGYSDEECEAYLEKTEKATCGFCATPEKNRLDHARLYKAYSDYIKESGIGALASRCWPDFFTQFGTPVCTVLSMLNDDKIASACECDIYGALSMWVGMMLSEQSVFFGDPVALDEKDNTITFWHCGAAGCSLARKDTGATIGVHPNRKIGPAMDFGCEAFEEATIFRIGRKPDGTFRFFIEEGKALDRPKQYIGTSIVVETEKNAREIVEKSVKEGYEPHFVIIKGHYKKELEALFDMLAL